MAPPSQQTWAYTCGGTSPLRWSTCVSSKRRAHIHDNQGSDARTACRSPRCSARRCAMSQRAMRSAAESAAGNRRSACSSTASAALDDGHGALLGLVTVTVAGGSNSIISGDHYGRTSQQHGIRMQWCILCLVVS